MSPQFSAFLGGQPILSGHLRFFSLPEFNATDLATGSLRQLVYELYLARVLVRGGRVLGVLLELFDQLLTWLVVSGEDHKRLYYVPLSS